MTRRILAAAILLSTCLAHAETITGKVVGVSDGDTLTLLTTQNLQVRVRLHGVDAPEARQAFGTKAKQTLSDLVYRKDVTAEVRDTDRYGRKVAVVKAGEKNVNLEMVRQGMAWWYRQYAKDDKELAKAETEAWKAKRGLWSDPYPVAPWEFRRQQR